MVYVSPSGFLAIETGWMVTELGRQPWVVQNIMRTKDAVTPMNGLIIPFTTFTLLYIFLFVIVVFLIKRQVVQSPTITQSGVRRSDARNDNARTDDAKNDSAQKADADE